ncbi:MAG: hypothetical protein PHO66_02740 [Eubacteriales bacterium]|nr:hypothetical protein [Eubacteriales bacterium]
MLYQEERSQEYLDELKLFLEQCYGREILCISKAERGFYGETWAVKTPQEKLFVKIVYFKRHQRRYARSFAAIDYIHRCGVDFISSVVPTRHGRLYARFGQGIVGVFRYVEGIRTEEYPLQRLFERMTHIYKLPTGGLDVPREDFNVDDVAALQRNKARLNDMPTSPPVARALALLDGHQADMEHYAQRLAHFRQICLRDPSQFFITNGDVGGNVILSGEDMVLIDWDSITIAPLERDMWPYMHMQSQIDLLNRVLADHAIHYAARPERLAFYCYRSYFYYLREYLCGLIQFQQEPVRRGVAEDLERFFDHSFWMYQNLDRADTYA